MCHFVGPRISIFDSSTNLITLHVMVCLGPKCKYNITELLNLSTCFLSGVLYCRFHKYQFGSCNSVPFKCWQLINELINKALRQNMKQLDNKHSTKIKHNFCRTSIHIFGLLTSPKSHESNQVLHSWETLVSSKKTSLYFLTNLRHSIESKRYFCLVKLSEVSVRQNFLSPPIHLEVVTRP